jgi:hypothetical protein
MDYYYDFALHISEFIVTNCDSMTKCVLYFKTYEYICILICIFLIRLGTA